jgi:hypothetical protein
MVGSGFYPGKKGKTGSLAFVGPEVKFWKVPPGFLTVFDKKSVPSCYFARIPDSYFCSVCRREVPCRQSPHLLTSSLNCCRLCLNFAYFTLDRPSTPTHHLRANSSVGVPAVLYGLPAHPPCRPNKQLERIFGILTDFTSLSPSPDLVFWTQFVNAMAMQLPKGGTGWDKIKKRGLGGGGEC